MVRSEMVSAESHKFQAPPCRKMHFSVLSVRQKGLQHTLCFLWFLWEKKVHSRRSRPIVLRASLVFPSSDPSMNRIWIFNGWTMNVLRNTYEYPTVSLRAAYGYPMRSLPHLLSPTSIIIQLLWVSRQHSSRLSEPWSVIQFTLSLSPKFPYLYAAVS